MLITAEYISQPTTVYTSFAEGTSNISYVIHTVVGGEEKATPRFNILRFLLRSAYWYADWTGRRSQQHSLGQRLNSAYIIAKFVGLLCKNENCYTSTLCILFSRDGSVGIATSEGVDGLQIDRRDFPHTSVSTPLYNGYRVYFTGVKRPERGVDTPTLF